MIWQNISSLTGKRFSHWEAAFFADWSDKQCDYATNAVVHNFYNKEKAYWWRQNKFPKFLKVGDYLLPEEAARTLLTGRPITVGLDKYALFGVSSNLVPKDILRTKYNDLINDKVVRYKLKLENSKLIWTEI
jgi:hypothetical protein